MTDEVLYWAGLDLGQQQDFSALTVLEVRRPLPPSAAVEVVETAAMGKMTTLTEVAPVRLDREAAAYTRDSKLRRYACRGIRRWDLGTPYTVIVSQVTELFSRPPLSGSSLVIDATGVGRAVVNMFEKARDAGEDCPVCGGGGQIPDNPCPRCGGRGKIRLRASIRPVTITAGSGASVDGAGWRVSKKELVSVLQVLLQSSRLKIERSIKEAALLTKELEMFRVKVTSAANESFEAWRERDHDDLVLSLAVACWASERGTQQLWVR